MALIVCSECGKEFSDKAPACPNCGCPTSDIISAQIDPVPPFQFHFTDLRGVSLDIEDGRVELSKGNKVLNSNILGHLRWSNYSEKGKITVHLPWEFRRTLFFRPEDNEQIRNLMAHTEEKYVAAPSIIHKNTPCCPKCGSVDIFIANTKMKTTLNLNPLKPFTLTNHKATRETWMCKKCGNRWDKKI